jgi:uncharacterized Rmd1/YagE family protein
MTTETPAQLEVVIHLAFAFDVGYEIDLERGRGLLAGESAGLVRRRRTPESIRYRPAPLRVAVDVSGLALPGAGIPTAPPRGELSLFDFGAVSLTIQHPIAISPEGLLRLAAELADPAPLTAAARLTLAPWFERIRPVVENFELSDLTEEFVIFQFGAVEPGWLETHEGWLAGLVRLESDPLSPEEIREAARLHLAYSRNDLVVLDWGACVVADRECHDTLQIIEFANVQLLEFRHIDDRLDDRLEAAYRQIRATRRRRWTEWFHDPGAEAMRRVRELELEATSLFERADNALKLIGDQYLSRVYAMASARFHLGEWQQSIRRKLDTVGDVFDLLTQQASGRRLEGLEVIVILLIALEIVLALFRH